MAHPHDADDNGSWAGDFDPFADPEERRVLYAAFDSFRCVAFLRSRMNGACHFWCCRSLGGVSCQPLDITTIHSTNQLDANKTANTEEQHT